MDDEQAKSHVSPGEIIENTKAPDHSVEEPAVTQADTPTSGQKDQSTSTQADGPTVALEQKTEQPVPQKSKRHLTKKTKLLVALVVLLAFGGGTATYVLLLSKDKSAKA